VVDRVTLRRSSPFSSTFFGLDNRELVPPFLPGGSGQDTLFGLVLSKCFYDNYFVQLPFALLHEPVEVRRFTLEQIVESRPVIGGIAQLIGLLARQLNLGSWKADARVRLRMLGRYLQELGCMPRSDFTELVCLQAWQVATGEISRLESAIRQAGESRQYWVDDVRIYLKNRRNRLIEKDASLPYDLCQGREPGRVLEITQRLVHRFGELLEVWPDIIECARELRTKGHRLAQGV
jgi:hypothetical protein